jgi:uncharacterized protein (DUF1684 family)
MNRTLFAIGAALFVLAACSRGAAGVDNDADYEAEVKAWRIERLEKLKAADGYLNLAGLFWLQNKSNHFGSADDADVVFPLPAPANIGRFDFTPDGIVMTVADGVDVMVDGEAVDSILMLDDTTETPVTATIGSLAWVVVNREGKTAIRLRDFEHPALDALPPIPSYEIDPSWRVEGQLIPFDEPRVMNVGTVIEGLGYNPESPGVMTFELDGKSYELEAYQSGEQLFFVFGDQTSGRETYPAGRFFYAEAPDENGKTILDFNKSYNPPCAFGDFSTCPVASPRNRLAVRIEAGEKFIPELHVGSLTRH